MPPPDKTPPITPKLRNCSDLDLHSAIRSVVAKVVQDKTHYPFKTCLNCTKFIESMEHCKLYNARPPARVIAFGCSSHDDIDQNEEIPF